jgi:hypothetical protein
MHRGQKPSFPFSGNTRQEFGLTLDEIGEMVLEHRRDAGLQLLAPGAQQGAVGRVLHQSVLEQVRGLGRDAAAE